MTGICNVTIVEGGVTSKTYVTTSAELAELMEEHLDATITVHPEVSKKIGFVK